MLTINWNQLFTILICFILQINCSSSSSSQLQSSTTTCSKLQQCQSETIPMINHQPNFGDPKWPLTYTCRPYCDHRDSLTSQTTWTLVYKTKIYLDQKCDRESGIMDSQCYRNNDVKKCENLNPSPGSINQYNCWKYNRFRDCVHSAIRTDCSPQEQNLVNQYLIDRSKNMSWLCINITSPPSSSQSTDDLDSVIIGSHRKVLNEPIDKNSAISSSSSTSSSGSGPTDRDMTVSGQFIGYPTVVGPPPPLISQGDPYLGAGGGVVGGYPPPLNDGLHGSDRIPIGGRYPYPGAPGVSGGLYPSYGSQPYDSVRPSYSYPSGSASVEICLERSRYLAQHCENALLQSQRFAHHYRTPSEVQRVICCGLFYYRDCMFQVINHVCPGSDPFILSMVLPYTVNQQLATCRTYTRGQCSTGLRPSSSWTINLIPIIILFVHFLS